RSAHGSFTTNCPFLSTDPFHHRIRPLIKPITFNIMNCESYTVSHDLKTNASAMVVSVSPPSAWQEAVQRSQALLSAAERDRFGSSGPDDIIRDFQAAQHSRGQASKVQTLLRKMQPFVSAVERFGKPLDVMVNISPEILSPAWGALRVVLLIARDFESYFSKLMEMLQQIVDAMPGFQVYEQLFQKHQTLREALATLYLEIIVFLCKAKKVFSSSSFHLFGRVLWKPFEQTFRESLGNLKRHSNVVEREAKLAHMVDEAQARLELVQVRALVESQNTQQAPGLLQTKSWLDARQCHEERDELETGTLPGTCDWILERPEISSWIDQESIRLFWLRGAPGCGKSFLYGKLLDHLATKAPLVYFMFCGADNKRVTVSSLLRSWTFQLTKIFPQAMRTVVSTMQASENCEATSKEVQGLFLSLLAGLPSCFLTVDALDECQDRIDLFRLLSRIPERFKILITSRPLPDISNHLSTNAVHQAGIEISPEMSTSDITQYISHKLRNGGQEYGKEVTDRIKNRLVGCGGMFLWVRLMLQHVQEQTSEDEVIHCLDELPQSLSERYDDMMSRINSQPKPQRLLAHKVFFWMDVARRPLEIKELCALLAVRPSSDTKTGFEPSRRVRDPESTIMSLTAFYDVQQLKSSDSLAAAVCMRYLSLDMITEELCERIPESHFDVEAVSNSGVANLDALLYAATNWFHHMAMVPDGIENAEPSLLTTAAELLDETRLNKDIWWHMYWFAGPDSSESRLCPQNFSPVHVAAYFGLTSLVRYFLPQQDPAATSSSGRSALWWSVTRGHLAATKLLVEAGIDPTQLDAFSISAVHQAAAIGDTDIFEAIISAPQQSGGKIVVDSEGWTPLHWAAARGHSAITQRIFCHRGGKTEYGTRGSRTASGRTPLHLAALNGKTELIAELAGRPKFRDLVNIPDATGQTALHLAAFRGHLGTVKRLLDCKADITIRDNLGKTAADRATDMGNDVVVSALAELSKRDHVQFNSGPRLSAMSSNLKLFEVEPLEQRFISTFTSKGQPRIPSCSILKIIDRRAGRIPVSDFVNEQDDRGWVALHYAVVGQFDILTATILKAGASALVANQRNETPYDLALKEGHRGTIEAFVRSGQISTSQLTKDLAWNEAHTLAHDGLFTVNDAERLDKALLVEHDILGRTPLFRAAEMGNQQAAQLLNDRIPTPLEVPDLVKLAVVALMADPTSFDIAHRFLGQLPLLSLPAADDNTQASAQQLLITAAKHNNVSCITSLAQAGVDIDGRETDQFSDQSTALQVAIKAGSTDSAICLVEAGADVHLVNSLGATSLLLACRERIPEVVRCHLEHGADPNKQNSCYVGQRHSDLSSPLKVTFSAPCSTKSVQIAELLINHGAHLVQVGNEAGSPIRTIMMALAKARQWAYTEEISCCHQILELIASKGYGLLVQIMPTGFYAPIHDAAKRGDVEAVRKELIAGVPVDWEIFYPYSDTSDTALMIAVDENDAEMVALLLEYGADLKRFSTAAVGSERYMLNYRNRSVKALSSDVRRLLEEGCRGRGLQLLALTE
ncbi:hypothetical protein B0T19DRAFT_457863, partial [Cercophora scortea]